MKRIFIIAALVTVLVGCSSHSAAHKALTAAGYSDIRTTGYAGPFACGEDDSFSTGFIATNPKGERVEGVVCSGFLKRGTIRF